MRPLHLTGSFRILPLRFLARGMAVPALLLAFSLPGCYLGPQPTATTEIVAQAADATATALLDAARADQRNFEIFRRSTFPVALPLLSGSYTCTEQLGLYCIDRVTGGLARMRVEELPSVAEARAVLIGSLQAARGRMPSDSWVQGQLIRYLVEGGDMAGAVAAAATCRADPIWWCFALAGYVYHHSGLAGASEEAFHVALEAMPAEERAYWLDISPILDPDLVTHYAQLVGDDLDRFEERFWRLADPLLTRPGNEILTEHLARRVDLALQLDAESAEGPLRDRLALETIGRYDLLLRYGTPSRWIRGMGTTGMVQVMSVDTVPCRGPRCRDSTPADLVYTVLGTNAGEVHSVRGVFDARRGSAPGPGVGLLAPPRGVRDMIATYELAPQDFLPPPGILLAQEAEGAPVAPDREWDAVREVPQTAYTLRMEGGEGRWIAPLAHQLAVFHRGDSAVVVAGWDLPAHGISPSAQLHAGVALLPIDDLLAPADSATSQSAPSGGVLSVATAARPTLVSVEAALTEERVMARARYELDIAPLSPLRIAISDLLLLHGSEEEVESLEEAVAIARGSTRVSPGAQLGVYWELYGLDPVASPEITMSIALHRPEPGAVGGALRWLGQAVGLVDDNTPIRVEWVEAVVAGPWMGRSLNLLVPELSEGRYTLVLTGTIPGREPVIATREVEVTRSTIAPPSAGTLVRRPEHTRPTGCLPETPITASAFSVEDARDYTRTPRCMFSPDPSWFGHYGGTENLTEFGYEGW